MPEAQARGEGGRVSRAPLDARALDGESEAAIALEERAADVERLRPVLTLGFVLWCGTGLLLAAFARFSERSPLGPLAAGGLLGAVALGAALARVRRGPIPGELGIRAILALGYAVPIVAVSLIAPSYRGITSPLGHAVLTIVTAYGITVPRPVWRSGPFLAILVAIYPLGMAIVAAFQPGLAAQFDDPRLAADFREMGMSQAVGALLACTASHAQWKLRRGLLEGRERKRYRIDSLLARGGMADIYRAFHPGLGREVALKVLSVASEPTAMARFVREVRATAALRHPHTVRILDCGTTAEGHPYYAMELLEGVHLGRLVELAGPLPPSRATYLVLAAARAIAEAHRRGLVHRDLKPENVFVCVRGAEHDFVKVLDFGIARSVVEAAGLTAEGTLVGTPSYMPIEQALGEKVDARADVFALGAVLYFALTGSPPFPGRTLGEALSALASGPAVPPSARGFDVPRDLESVVLRCLARAPAERFADASELAQALESLALAERHRPSRASYDAERLSRERDASPVPQPDPEEPTRRFGRVE
ncbi:MAG: serine/threonine-protein kinase [Polyangiales bacterium]